MADQTARARMARLVKKSSFGTPAARHLRSRTVSTRIVKASTQRAAKNKTQ